MRRLLLAAMLLASLQALAADFHTVPLYRDGSFEGLAPVVAVHELRDGGLPEIAVCAGNVVFTYSKTGNAYTRTWAGPGTCTSLAIGDLDGDGRSEIVAASGNGSSGTISILDPASLARRTITLPGGALVNAVAVGNVDADPAPEIVAVTNTNTYVYDGFSFALEWTATSRSGTGVAIAEIDGDGKNEIVLNSNGGDGAVLDGYTHTFKWGYLGGFGNPFTAADVDGDGKAELVGYFPSSNSQIKILNGDTFTTTAFDSNYTSGIAIGDANDDGTDEIIAMNLYGTLRGYNPADGSVLYEFYEGSDYGHGGVVADTDGNGTNELVWVGNSLHVTDVATLTTTHITGGVRGPYSVAAGDLDGDGRPEVIDALAMSTFSQASTQLEVRDGTTGAVRGTVALPNAFGATQIVVGQFDADPAREIAVLGHKNLYDAYLHIYDGATLALEYSSPVPAYNSPNITAQAIAVANVDGDAIDEIILARSDQRFLVLNGTTGVAQYVSDPLSSYVRHLAIADADGDSVQDLVVATDAGVSVYKTSDWSVRKTIAAPYADAIAATNGEILYATGGGYNEALVVLNGDTLTERWRCTAFPTFVADLASATINGTKRIVVKSNDGTLRLLPSAGNACPGADNVTLGLSAIAQIAIADVTGDGQPEILAGFDQYFEADLINDSTLPRGDVNADGAVTDADIDALALYLYNRGTGAPATADVNGDGCILGDDLFYLINYRRGTGAAPPP